MLYFNFYILGVAINILLLYYVIYEQDYQKVIFKMEKFENNYKRKIKGLRKLKFQKNIANKIPSKYLSLILIISLLSWIIVITVGKDLIFYKIKGWI